MAIRAKEEFAHPKIALLSPIDSTVSFCDKDEFAIAPFSIVEGTHKGDVAMGIARVGGRNEVDMRR